MSCGTSQFCLGQRTSLKGRWGGGHPDKQTHTRKLWLIDWISLRAESVKTPTLQYQLIGGMLFWPLKGLLANPRIQEFKYCQYSSNACHIILWTALKLSPIPNVCSVFHILRCSQVNFEYSELHYNASMCCAVLCKIQECISLFFSG